MTGYTVHTGASKDFVAGWDKIFGDQTEEKAEKKNLGKKKKKKKAEKAEAKKSASRKSKSGKKQ